MLFTSDSDLRDIQRRCAHLGRGQTLSAEQTRAEAIEADRELREHQRWREFAWLLFIAPIWAAVLIGAVQILIALFLRRAAP